MENAPYLQTWDMIYEATDHDGFFASYTAPFPPYIQEDVRLRYTSGPHPGVGLDPRFTPHHNSVPRWHTPYAPPSHESYDHPLMETMLYPCSLLPPSAYVEQPLSTEQRSAQLAPSSRPVITPSVHKVVPSPTSATTREPLRSSPPFHDTDTVRMERMMRVFTIPPGNSDELNLDVDPRIFVHKVHCQELVETEDPEGVPMPWLLDDTDAEVSPDGLPSREAKKSKILQCKTCRKWFDRPSALAVHANAHSGNKPYKCPHPTCDRYFSVHSNARRHLRTHDD